MGSSRTGGLDAAETDGHGGDSVSCEGRTLLKSFVAASAQRGDSVHVLSFDVSEDQFKAGLSTELTSLILFHDAFRDPLGWAGEESVLTLGDFSASELAARLAPATQGPATVVLDSLSWLLLRLPFPSVCQALVQLPRRASAAGVRITRLLALLHRDLHPHGELETLHSLAGVVVMLELAPETMPRGDGVPQTAVMLHRKRRGQVVRKKEYFVVLPSLDLKPLHEPSRDAVSIKEGPEDCKVSTAADPTANLTFNLRLSEAERQAKESVPLPYHFSEEKKSSLLQTPAGVSKVYYEPDASDDVDEEDPDDDLDV
ncbi:elongator complex protein 5 isoform X2 [Hemicordylus capensis]|uniref:elongator complex protein 5 isoform X2 n=1 Tax=Hemicordylus capensis TaxID=884348 RepID=UPI00230330FA|nr:elongator complex protein 5 isoform X2 [Hemicordylus capensis]